MKGQHAEGDSTQTHLISQSKNIVVHSVNPTTALHVEAKLENYSCSFLIDTGAAVTLVSRRVWDHCQVSSQYSLQPWTKQQLLGIDGSPLTVLGTTRVPLKFHIHFFQVDIVVVDGISEDAVLGMDFLQHNDCHIDIGRKLMYVNSRNFSISLDSGKPITIVNAVLKGTTVVPPYSECEVLTQVSCKGDTWLVENKLQKTVTVARAIVSPKNQQVVLRLVNPTADSVKIYKGMKVAQLEKVEDTAVTISAVTHNPAKHTSQDVSEQKQQLLWQIVLETQGLTEEQQHEFYLLLLNYADIFASSDSGLGCTTMLKHSINTGNASPIRQAPRRLPAHRQQEATRLVNEMLQKDIIERSTSPWSSPVVLVTKKDGSIRFCIDYRKVNEVTKKDAYPLPRIDSTLETLAGSKLFTTLDLLSGYWQVELAEADREKTAFATKDGLFQFKVLPFGLCNGPATFQRLMDLVLSGLQWSTCLVYLDDVIILGHDFSRHLQNLVQVFNRIREAGLKIKPTKCNFLQKSVKYLGHIVSETGIATDPAKVEKVSNWPVPTSCKELRQFLGLASYYRRFVRDFAKICQPLHRLTEKNCRFIWTPSCQESFDKLRKCLVSAPILVYPNFAKPFILDTDASETGLGGVLSQLQDDGKECVIAYASRALTKPERRYSVTRKELLAAVTFTQQFRHYLLGSTFTLRTDHHSLKWLKNFKNPEGQLARWLEKLEEYSFVVEHRSGRKHGNADSLSRSPQSLPVYMTTLSQPFIEDHTNTDLRTLQLQDPVIGPVLVAKENNKLPSRDTVSGCSLQTRRLFQIWDQLSLTDGLLTRLFHNSSHEQVYNQIIVPKVLRSEILEKLHVPGHLGQEKMLSKLKMRFYWPGHYNDVKEWCVTCSTCATRKTPPPKNKGPLSCIHNGNPMQLVSADIVGPFPDSHNHNRYILVVVDHFTKWGEAYPIPNQEATTVAKVLVNEFFFRFSPPEQFHTDQGRQFESILVKEICKLLHIKKSRTSPYHPQGDGLAERFNRTILNMLSTTAKHNPENWEDYIRSICFVYNTSVTGYTPFYLMYGREARLPIDLTFSTHSANKSSPAQYASRLQDSLSFAYDLVRSTLGEVQCRQKELYDRKIHGEPFKEGDLVWLYSSVISSSDCRKLHHPWTGPYRIVAKLSDITYKIAPLNSPNRYSVVHFDRLKLCPPNIRIDSPPQQQLPSLDVTPCVGKNVQLIDNEDAPPIEEDNSAANDDTDTNDHSDIANDTLANDDNTSTRYPQRQRHQPDWLHPFVRY